MSQPVPRREYQACISGARLADTGFSYTLSLIQGKYKMTILYTLMTFGVVRFNEMKRYIGSISYKTLSAALKELDTPVVLSSHEGLVRSLADQVIDLDGPPLRRLPGR